MTDEEKNLKIHKEVKNIMDEMIDDVARINSVVIVQKYFRRSILIEKNKKLLRLNVNEIRISQDFNGLNIVGLLIMKILEKKGINKKGKSRKGVHNLIEKKSGNIIIPKKNKGEKGETKIIEYLVDNMDNEETIYKIFSIKSKIKLIDPSNNEIIYDKESIKKSSGYFKADIIIDFIDVSKKYNVSIKCNDGAPPTLLNHTSLCAKCWHTERLKEYVPTLTKIINDLNDKRKKGIYKEDILYTDMELDENQINTIINIISYFTFEGTGSSESKCPANSVLVVGNSYDVLGTSNFKGCETHEMKLDYIKSMLPDLRFSLRSSKGMPTKKENIDKCRPWIYEYIDKKGNTKLCGALHIRFI